MSSAMLRLASSSCDAHLGLEAQARERRAQVVRDAGEHHRAVLLDLGELARHPVEAHVDLADLAGHRVLVEARVELALADAAGGERQVLERPVDQPRDRRRAEHGGEQRDADPEDQRARSTSARPGVGSACSQYGSLSIEKPTHRPGAPFIELATTRVGPELRRAARARSRAEAVDLERLPLVGRLARRAASPPPERRHALDDGDAVDAVGAAQRRARRG